MSCRQDIGALAALVGRVARLPHTRMLTVLATVTRLYSCCRRICVPEEEVGTPRSAGVLHSSSISGSLRCKQESAGQRAKCDA